VDLASNRPRSSIHGTAAVWTIRIALAVAFVVGAYLTFEFGRIQADFNVVDAAQERQDYEERIEELQKEIVALKQEIALLETHRDIDREAYQDVEASLSELQEKIQEQRDAIAFYRGIISPADGQRGLRVQDLRLSKGKDDRQYHIRLVLVQVMQHDRSVKGEVNFSLEGAQDGVATTYTLEQLVPEDEDGNWPFSFRYFQDFDRQLILPEGFLPERINIEVLSRTKSIASVKQSFLWQTGQS
jgi:septal ring factor EnvC (AmiA/AmiB activator)